MDERIPNEEARYLEQRRLRAMRKARRMQSEKDAMKVLLTSKTKTFKSAQRK